jgi:hypothetical protein
MYSCEGKIAWQADWKAFALESGGSATGGELLSAARHLDGPVGVRIAGQRSIVAKTSDLAPAPVNQLYILVS